MLTYIYIGVHKFHANFSMDEIEIKNLREGANARKHTTDVKDMKEWLNVELVGDRDAIEKRSGLKYSPLIELWYLDFVKLFATDPMHILAGISFLYMHILLDICMQAPRVMYI